MLDELKEVKYFKEITDFESYNAKYFNHYLHPLTKYNV